MHLRQRHINRAAITVMIVLTGLVILRAMDGGSEAAVVWTAGVLSALSVTAFLLLLSLSRRLRLFLTRKRNSRAIPRTQYAAIDVFLSAENAAAEVRRVLGSGVVSVVEKEDLCLLRSKGQAGLWGSVVFHAGLLLLITGLFLSQFGASRQSVALTEGETCVLGTTGEGNSRTASIISIHRRSPALDLKLQRLECDLTLGSGTTSASHLVAEADGERVQALARVNRSMTAGSWVIHHSGNWGFSPVLLITDADDSVLFHASIRMPASPSKGGAFTDSASLGEGMPTLALRLYPDFIRTAAGDSSRSTWPRNPVLFITWNNDDGTRTEIPLAMGQFTWASGVRIAFPRLLRWSQLDAVRDPGLDVLLYGCIVAVLGLFLRISFTEKTVGAVISRRGYGAQIRLVGRSEKYPCSFRAEMQSLERRLRTELRDE